MNLELESLILSERRKNNFLPADHLYYGHLVAITLTAWYTEAEQIEVLTMYRNYLAYQSAKKQLDTPPEL